MNSHAHKISIITRIAKSKWSWLFVLATVLLTLYLAIVIRSAINSMEYALTPPQLPTYIPAETEYLNPIGWPEESSTWFHHASQGTATIPIPYEWLVALEAPKSNPWLIFLGKEKPYIHEYFLKLGFIKQSKSASNPDALPIGIAKTESIYFPGIDRKATAVGFTCSACHTGQLLYNNKRYVVDGGPAMIDLGLLTKSLGAALGQTALSSKFSITNGRFDRFARKVLGSNDNIASRRKLKEGLSNTLKVLVENQDVISVTEGFTRLDALNRIGNQVFDNDMQRKANYSPINAPVNYPHIWTTSWFNWVQYDGSIMQPLIRNTGEALGVKAYLDTLGPNEQRFASSVNIKNLVKAEKWLAGTHPLQRKQFNGLTSPQWPESFPNIDKELASQGRDLYQELCQSCHLPPVNSEAFWSEKYWKKIQFISDFSNQETENTYLHLNILPLQKIGTDPAQASVLADRTVDTTNLGLDTSVCTWVTDEDYSLSNQVLKYVRIKDSATSNFGLALGATVARTNHIWFEQNFIPLQYRGRYEGERPNCLQLSKGYKARPLNGVWATAPFLHNGSVATIYDLLSPLEIRPVFVELGSQEFDAKYLGIKQSNDIKQLNQKSKLPSYKAMPDYTDGLFILDTRDPGNHNTGHIFDDPNPVANNQGIIGRKLAEKEKLALIEYLKTL